MAKYAGLTNDIERRKGEHGNPSDWEYQKFSSEKEARDWEKSKLSSGYRGGTGGEGWRYGYEYTITNSTKE